MHAVILMVIAMKYVRRPMCNSAATRPSSQITLGRLVYLRNECSTIYTYAKYNNWMIKRKVKNCKMIIT